MSQILKPIKNLLRGPYNNLISKKRELEFKRAINSYSSSDLKLVIGASRIFQKGWIASEYSFFDVTDEASWSNYFSENSISNIFAEHVWEHISQELGAIAIKHCFNYLKPGGRLRIAVPDGLHADPDYIETVRPGGNGEGADDHKVLYDHRSLGTEFKDAGFEVELVEYFDEENEFYINPWKKEDGLVRRSLSHDDRNHDGKPNYTSLIVDGIK